MPLLIWILIAVAVLVAGARAALLVVRVDGTSMTPAFGPGERVLAVRKWLTTLPRGSVVVLRHPEEVPVAGPDGTPPPVLVKRLVGLPGDDQSAFGGAGPVPPGRIYVLGDGPGSYDSATFGAVPAGLVIARVVARLTG